MTLVVGYQSFTYLPPNSARNQFFQEYLFSIKSLRFLMSDLLISSPFEIRMVITQLLNDEGIKKSRNIDGNSVIFSPYDA